MISPGRPFTAHRLRFSDRSISNMTGILFPLLLVSCMGNTLPGADARESVIESKCLTRIRQHYKEPAEVRSDRDYKTMKLKALLFVGNDGAVKSSELLRDSQVVYLPDPGKQEAKPPEPDYKGLSTPEKTKAVEDALLRAVKKSSPLPVAGCSYAGPYSMSLEYAPTAKTPWILRLGPPPQKPPVEPKKR